MHTSCNSRGSGRVLAQLPRLIVFHVGIGAIGQADHQPHGLAVVAGLVGGANFVARSGRRGKQTAIVGILWREAGLLNELRRATGQIHDLVHQIGIHLGHELVDRQIEVVDSDVSFEA